MKHTKLPGDMKKQFSEIVLMIQKARYNALKSVNSELISLYLWVGEYIHKKVESAEWGMSVVDKLAEYLLIAHPELKGFNRRGLYRMKQFYESYKNNKRVSALLTQLSWSNHLLILSKTKNIEEKEFLKQIQQLVGQLFGNHNLITE